MTELQATINMIRNIRIASDIKVGRNFIDFFSDRILQASHKTSLLSFAECLMKLVAADPSKIQSENFQNFLKACQSDKAYAILLFIREYYKTVMMLTQIKEQDILEQALSAIEIKPSDFEVGKAKQRGQFQIPIKTICLSPLSHGSDLKAGNAMLYRRHDILSDTGHKISLPYYAGNALRGQIRDCLADYFLTSLDVKISRNNPDIAFWFFYMLYSGGALGEDNKAKELMSFVSGSAGQVKIQKSNELRELLPHLSALGFAIGNRIFSGRFDCHDLEPQCKEYGNSEVESADLISWEYLTRREDLESHEENHSMIAVTEVLISGTVLTGGIDFHYSASELEKSAIAKGLSLLQESKSIGGSRRRGFGRIDFEFKNLPDKTLYEKFLTDNKEKIKEFFVGVGAFDKTLNEVKEEKKENTKKKTIIVSNPEVLDGF